jgi:hypothetical protein
MDETPSIEKALESDIGILSNSIQFNREKVTVQNYNERELVKEAIRAFPNLEKPSAAVPVPQPGQAAVPQTVIAPSSAVSSNVLPDYAQNAAPEVKLEIEYLLDLALRDGIGKALAASEKSPYFVQDAFHDALAGKLYPELQKRGIVK